MRFIKWFFSLLFVLTTAFGCKSERKLGVNDDFNISVDELFSLMKADSTVIILDVRMPDELIGPLGKIENVINIPVQELNERVSELDDYKPNFVAVICRSGNRSITATKIMKNNGFNAKNVLGGMKGYNKFIEKFQ